jgi:toxin ParE1/3/4
VTVALRRSWIERVRRRGEYDAERTQATQHAPACMRLVIREEAARDLEEIFQYIAQDDRQAARAVVLVVRGRMRELARSGFINIGRRSCTEGTRELVEAPYVIVYTVDDWEQQRVVTLVAEMHGSRDR